MSSNYYTLQVIRVENVPRKANGVSLQVEIQRDSARRKTTIVTSEEGIPTQEHTLIFNDTDTLSVDVKDSANLIGNAIVHAEDLLKEFHGEDVRQQLFTHSRKKLFWGRLRKSRGMRLKKAGIIILRLKGIDDRTRAEIEVATAEQGVEHVEMLIERRERREEAIGAFTDVIDGIIGIVDDIVEVHPVFEVSWKAVTTLYKLLLRQLDNDFGLLGMVEDMQAAFCLSVEASKLNDGTKTLKPIFKELLEETSKCSRFVQGYTKRSFAVERMSDTDSMQTIRTYAETFTKLRDSLNTVIRLRTSKEVHDLSVLQQLEGLEEMLQPRKLDPSSMMSRPRCLEGTRQEYLDPIMEFLLDDKFPNILWLTGAAGSGKSTIAVTISDMCSSKGCSPAYMFFEREKSDPNTVVRTIAYMLAELYPSVGQCICTALQADKNISGTTIRNQFEKLLLEPICSAAADIAGPVIVILDALDECGSAAQRRDLLELLTKDLAKLPLKVRILMTSRPEADFAGCLSGNGGIRHIELRHDSSESRRDVDRYIRQEMAKVLGKKETQGVEIESLCNAADGLFVWASTAVKMVQNAVNKSRALRELAKDVQRIGGSGLDGLYATALNGSGLWEPASRDDASAVMGLILFAKEALDASIIEAFLGLEVGMVDALLNRLRSVVSYEPGKSIRLHHASLADYLLSSERSGVNSWHIDELKQKQDITEGCFGIMATNLRFNICDIESSFIPNSEVPELRERIEKNIPPHLSYACRCWSAHMCELTSLDGVIVDRLKDFAYARLLYWFEVLSLTECFARVACRALNDASALIESVDQEISSYFWSAYKLASVFAYPISQSVPHIYLSAISLWSGESPVAHHYSRKHPVIQVHRFGTKAPAQCIKVLKERGGHVWSVAISSDGWRIASSSQHELLQVWDADSGELLLSNLDMGGPGTAMFSPDNKHIMSCSRKGTIRVWEVGSGKVTLDTQLAAGCCSAAFGPDSDQVVLVSDKKVLIPNFYDGRLELYFNRFESEDGFRFRTVSSNGRYVIGTKDTTIGLWDTDTGKLVSAPFEGVGEWVTSFAVSPDGKRVVTTSPYGIRVYDPDTGELVASSKMVDVAASVSFSSGWKHVVLGFSDGSIAICDASSGRLSWGPVQGHTNPVTSVIFSPDSNRVISGSEDGTIRIWDVDGNHTDSGSSDAHAYAILSVAFSADGKRIVSGSRDARIRVWDAATGKLLSGPFELQTDYVESMSFSPDTKHVITGCADYAIRIWNVDGGRPAMEALKGHTGPVLSATFSTDGKRIASGSQDKSVCIWDAVSGDLVQGPLKAHTKGVRSVSFSADGDRVVSGSEDKTVCIWDADTGQLVVGPLPGHSGLVHSVTFSPGGQLIASGSGDGTVRIWDGDTGELVSAPLKGPLSDVYSISYSPDGKRIVSGSRDNTALVWDVDSGGLALEPLEGHTGSVCSVSFSPDGKYVVSGSRDKTIRVWDVSSDNIALVRNESNAKGDVTCFTSHHANTISRDSDQCRARSISNWNLHNDGWVKGEEGELLAWIPEDTRDTLCRARNIAVFSCQFSTKLDFLDSPLGEDWANGYPR